MYTVKRKFSNTKEQYRVSSMYDGRKCISLPNFVHVYMLCILKCIGQFIFVPIYTPENVIDVI